MITCIDGLTGFPEAISAVYPKTEIQQRVIHQICNSTKYVSYKDIKALMADLKKVYGAVSRHDDNRSGIPHRQGRGRRAC